MANGKTLISCGFAGFWACFDLLITNQLLYQLSYSSVFCFSAGASGRFLRQKPENGRKTYIQLNYYIEFLPLSQEKIFRYILQIWEHSFYSENISQNAPFCNFPIIIIVDGRHVCIVCRRGCSYRSKTPSERKAAGSAHQKRIYPAANC